MYRRVLWTLALLYLAGPASSEAQEFSFGLSAGPSIVGGGHGRVPVEIPSPHGLTVVGAGRHGWHARGVASYAIPSSPIDLRGEVFYNRLHSPSNSFSMIGSGDARSALVDEVHGFNLNAVGVANRDGTVVPFAVVGTGLYSTRLGSHDDPSATDVTRDLRGAGIGLNVGGGLEIRWANRRFLVEARFQRSFGDIRGSTFVPITVGFLF